MKMIKKNISKETSYKWHEVYGTDDPKSVVAMLEQALEWHEAFYELEAEKK